MAKQTKKPATVNTVNIVTLTKGLTDIAHEIGAALSATLETENRLVSLSATLGTLTRKAGKNRGMTLARVDAFAEECKAICINAGMQPDSLKVYLSNIRGVLRAIIAGYDPKEGETLRNMYNQRPKKESDKTGAQTVHKLDGKGTKGDKAAVKLTADQAREAAIRLLFGSFDSELSDAVRYAANNQPSFTRWVKRDVAEKAPAMQAARKAA